MRLRVGTRRSPLARAQTEHVCTMLRRIHPDVECEIVALQTTGDQVRDRPLREVGGKGLFVKELDDALMAGAIDFAVHSLKDVPSELPPGIVLASVPERIEACDVVVTREPAALEELPAGASLGTTSLRRGGQALALNGRLRVRMLRGNVETRLKRVREGEFDATLLAAAGLARLGVVADDLSLTGLDPWRFVPAPGQGALGVTALASSRAVLDLLETIDHGDAAAAVTAERAVAHALGGACDLPLGAFARVKTGTLDIVAVVAASDGRRILRREAEGRAADAATIGRGLAAELAADGAHALLAGAGG